MKAQTGIQGVVGHKADGKGLAGVNVTVKEKDAASVLAYAFTDQKGAYKLSFSSKADSVVVTVSGLGFKKLAQVIDNRSGTYHFSLDAEVIKLKEVKVNPPKIRKLNDTLNYLVDGFADKNDRTIGDVLKKMPGIRVADDGSITYNNKPINRFYIENLDLLKGRYGIATNNVEAKDVATVQVLENHQPVKALKNREFTDEAAINLKLKDGAKGVLTANTQLGTGLSPFLWNNELTSTYFNKGRQNINTYKGNNTGNDAGAELKSYYPGDNQLSPYSALTLQSPSAPPISQKRYLYNRANAASANNLWSLGKDYQLNANVIYLNDRQEKENFSRSVYYLPADSVLAIEENLAATTHTDLLETGLQLNRNTERYYLDNAFRFSGKWDRGSGISESGERSGSGAQEAGTSNWQNIFQDLKQPVFKVDNTFSLIRNYKRLSLKLYSYNGYSSTDQELSVEPFLYDALFGNAVGLTALRQSVGQRQFSSANRLTLGLTKGSWKQNYTLAADLNLQQLNTQLQGQEASGNFTSAVDSLSNGLTWNKYSLSFQPDYTYAKDKIKVTLQLPLVYNYLYRNNDNGNEIERHINRLLFNPSINIRYELNLFWNMTAAVSYNNEQGGIENGFTGYMMQSYRSLQRNEGQLSEQKNQSYSLDLGYRHPLHAVFFNLGLRHGRSSMNLLYGYAYQDILSFKKAYFISNGSNRYSIYARLSKGIDAIASTLSLDADYSSSSASQISQDKIIDFTAENFNLRPAISSKLGKWASLSYTFQYAQSRNRVRNNAGDFKPINSSRQQAQLNFFPVKALTINLGYENFYNGAIVSGSRGMNFADLGMRYVFKKVELSAEYANVFDTRQYIAAAYNDISTFYSVYNLRPAQLLLKLRFKIR
ncbi:carboxypeptidase-like regulatory domain-containing protein [Pedobacter africanus]|uniref:carboxypeptidase-like regulatory domain-containing protein n=1 Tax=Pedobacter africanus TaxID=151894 RepID=UPI000A013A1B|nr:carboxypeptidase-like regulatory domain-containing protein [Pedobacter africanus]